MVRIKQMTATIRMVHQLPNGDIDKYMVQMQGAPELQSYLVMSAEATHRGVYHWMHTVKTNRQYRSMNKDRRRTPRSTLSTFDTPIESTAFTSTTNAPMCMSLEQII